MNSRLSIQDLAGLLAVRTGKDAAVCEHFLKELIRIISEGVASDKLVKMKGFGTFKLIPVEQRESIHVNTGERFLIPAHQKLAFTPDKELRELVNKPFSFFETTEVEESVQFDDLPVDELAGEELMDEATGAEEEPEVVLTIPAGEAQTAIGKISGGIMDAEPQSDAEPQNDTESQSDAEPLNVGNNSEDQADKRPVPEAPVPDANRIEIPADAVKEVQSVVSVPETESPVQMLPETESPLQASAESVQESIDTNCIASASASESASASASVSESVSASELSGLTDESVKDAGLSEALADLIPKQPEIQTTITTSHTSSGTTKTQKKEIPEACLPQEKTNRRLRRWLIAALVVICLLILVNIHLYRQRMFYFENMPTGDITQLIDHAAQNPAAGNPTEEEIILQTGIDSDTQSAAKSETESVGMVQKANTGQTGTVVPEAASGKTIADRTVSETTTSDKTAPVSNVLDSVTIEPGSRLTLIALKYYGSKLYWVYIYEFNKAEIKDPNNIPVGTRIAVPVPGLYGIDRNNQASLKKAAELQTQILNGN